MLFKYGISHLLGRQLAFCLLWRFSNSYTLSWPGLLGGVFTHLIRPVTLLHLRLLAFYLTVGRRPPNEHGKPGPSWEAVVDQVPTVISRSVNGACQLEPGEDDH